MVANPRISLVFVNYRSSRYLSCALESLFSFERETDFFEVIVVNNDISERTELRALQQSFHFSLIESDENKGFGYANNLGAERASGELLAFINPDVLWTGARLREMAAVFDEHQKIGILGMTLLDESGRPETWSAGAEPSLATLFQNNLFPPRQLFQEEGNLAFPDWVSGGALFIRRGLFSEIGGFDERFFLYFEDVDLCTEARKRGVSVARHTSFPLTHLGGKSQISSRLQKKHFYDSQKKYFEKHRPEWESRILSWMQSIFCRI